MLPESLTASDLHLLSLPNIMDKPTEQLAINMGGKTDSIIRVHVTRALGNDQWILIDIASRMQRVQRIGEPQEVITLDGKPLLELWPVEVTTEPDGNAIKVVATQKYRSLLPDEQSESKK